MRLQNILWLGVCLLPLSWAQTRVDLANQSKGIDFSAASATKPSKTGTSIPGTCSIGETFFKTNAAAGKNLYACTATNSWTALASPLDVPTVTGMSGKVLSTDGANPSWAAPGGDISGSLSSLTVNKLQGRSVGSGVPSNGNVLTWNSTLSQWQPISPSSTTYVSGGGIAIAGSSVAIDSATVPQYSIGAGVPSLSCDAGRDFYTDTINGNLYFCKATNTWQLLSKVSHVHSASEITSGTLALSQGGTNKSTWVAGRCVQVAVDGTSLESAPSACGPRASTGSGAPSAACSAGQDLYTDTSSGNLYFCSATNTWQLISRSGHTHPASDIASGTVPLARGGTNQSTWVAGRCVQVKADGTTLESASAACGPRTTTGAVAPLGLCTAGQDIYTDTTTGNLYYCSATDTWQLLSRSSHSHSASDVTSGTLGLARGGTNQATWIAGRCVQVKSDGTTLESASAACGPRTTTGAIAPSGSCTAGQDIYTDTTAGNLYYCSVTNTWQLISRSGHAHAGADITSGTIASARLGSGGLGTGAKVLYDDQTFKTPAVGGGVTTVSALITTPATSATYTLLGSTQFVHYLICGSGGGGGGGTATNSGGGGGGGGCEEGTAPTGGSSTITYTVPAGGAGGAAAGNGGNGAPTSFILNGVTYVIFNPSQYAYRGNSNGSGGYGGTGFLNLNASAGGALGTTGSTGSRKELGGGGGGGRNTASSIGATGGSGACGGGGGGSYGNVASVGGTSFNPLVGGNGASGGATSAAGSNASVSCVGGGGGSTDGTTGQAGGAGGSGFIRFSYSY